MSRPPIHSVNLNTHLNISECHPDSECHTNNWWLYDKRAGQNIGMRTKTRDAALVGAIEYWAKRAIKAEQSYSSLRAQVDDFVGQFTKPEEDCDD